MEKEHIVGAFDADLDRIENEILEDQCNSIFNIVETLR